MFSEILGRVTDWNIYENGVIPAHALYDGVSTRDVGLRQILIQLNTHIHSI